MENYPLVLLANEPGTYRSLLATELPILRPNLRIVEVSPDELDSAVIRHRPAVVICSRVLETVQEVDFTLLVLYPNGADTLIRPVNGTHQEMPSPRLSDLLNALDGAIPLLQAS
jgi:hypothetical protein